MTTSTILALTVAVVGLLPIVGRNKIDRYTAQRRAAKARQQAAEDQAIEAYFAPLRQDHDDYLASLSLGFTEDPEAFAARIAARNRDRYTPALLAITDTDTRIPAQTRKEQS